MYNLLSLLNKKIVVSTTEPDLASSIKLIENLPNFILNQKGIPPKYLEGNQKLLLLKANQHCQAIASLLRFYLLNDISIKSYLDSNYFNYKDHAEILAMQLKLIQELFFLSDLSKKLGLSPLEYWMNIRWECCEIALHDNGLLGKPIIESNRNALDRRRKVLKEYLETNAQVLEVHITNSDSIYLTMMYLFSFQLASVNSSFRRHILYEYIKTELRCLRSIRNNPQLKPIYLQDDGKLFIMTKHKRGKDKQKRKVRS